jgi:hypothetical protein
LSIEHHRAIHVLVEFEFYGSAFALYRLQFEAFVRGAWLRHCATDSEVADFAAGKDPPSPGRMLDALEGVETFGGSGLREHKTKVWKKLCDFTHGGAAQASGRLTRDEVRSNYSDAAVSAILSSASALSWLSAAGIADLCGDAALVDRIGHAYETR